MTFTGSIDEPTQNEPNSQVSETPLSQRGTGQNVLFATPLERAQSAASQVNNEINSRSQQQNVGNGTDFTFGNGNGQNAGNGNGTGVGNISVTDFMRAMSQQMHVHDFRRDGEKVNVRGGIDRVLRDSRIDGHAEQYLLKY